MHGENEGSKGSLGPFLPWRRGLWASRTNAWCWMMDTLIWGNKDQEDDKIGNYCIPASLYQQQREVKWRERPSTQVVKHAAQQ